MSAKAQEFLFQRIKELLPPHVTLVDAIAGILNLSSDSAYRRIRGETPMVLDEVSELCSHYNISLDQLLNITSHSILFENVRVNSGNYDYIAYLKGMLAQIQYVQSFTHKNIIYLTKDIPVFHNFYDETLLAFRYFFWMKTIIHDRSFEQRKFDFNCVTPEIISLSRQITQAYNCIPSTEIWNTECINSTISQIEFYRESGYFSSVADIRAIYESLEKTMLHLKDQVEYGSKFMPGENPETRKDNFSFFYNRVVLGNNTILVTTDNTRIVFFNYEILHYMFTRDEGFCNACNDDLKNQIKRATLISQTGERHRNIFFGILLNKIRERKKYL